MSIKSLAVAALASAVLTGLPAALSAQGADHGAAGNMERNTGAMQHPALHTVTLYKEKNCDCCGKWAEHLRKAGFPVKVVEVADIAPTKAKYGVSETLRTCHTATIAGYVIEGHVPADAIRKLLTEKPKNIVGIAVAGMPMGSPGMEEGGQKDHYDIVTFDRQGKTLVYARR